MAVLRAWEISRHFPTHSEMTSEVKRAQKFHTNDMSLLRSGSCFWLAEAKLPRDPTNQKHYPVLGNNASPVRNFCSRCTGVISRRNQCWRREMSADFSGCCFKLLDVQTKKVHIGKSFVFVWPQSPHIRESRFQNPNSILLVESGITLKESGIPLRLESGIQFLQTT